MTDVAATVDISKALTIGGWMSEGELLWLATQAKERKRIVEFGCLHGRSTRALADNNDGTIWAVDPWSGDYFDENGEKCEGFTTYVMPNFLDNLADHIASQHVIPVRRFSYSFKLNHKVDMVFIDGDHRYDSVLKDIKKAYDLLEVGGLISGHDYGHPMWPGVKRAVDELVSHVAINGQIWWSIK
jgi:predicted O-methyltransferase YrrM